MDSKWVMKERLVRAIGHEHFRRMIGPGWNEIAAQIAERIMDDLGMMDTEVSKVYPAREGREVEPYVEDELRSAFAHHVANETPMSLTIERGKADQYPGMSRMSVRGWIITKSTPHDQ